MGVGGREGRRGKEGKREKEKQNFKTAKHTEIVQEQNIHSWEINSALKLQLMELLPPHFHFLR